ncbi:unnamed protein product [Boreogadus saida]
MALNGEPQQQSPQPSFVSVLLRLSYVWSGLPAPTPRHRAVHERCCCLATRVHKMRVFWSLTQTTVPSQARRRVRGDGPEDDCLQEGRRPLGAEEVEVEDGEQEALAEREEAGDAGLQ